MGEETNYTIWDAVKRLDGRIDALDDRLHNLEQGARLQEERQGALAKRVAELESRLDQHQPDTASLYAEREAQPDGWINYDCTCVAGTGEHDKKCPLYCPF